MRMQIQYVADRGDLSGERLVMRVRQDVDIGDFMLVRTGFEDDEVTTDVSNALWFPYRRLRAGDLVVVYSKRGRDRRKQLGPRPSRPVGCCASRGHGHCGELTRSLADLAACDRHFPHRSPPRLSRRHHRSEDRSRHTPRTPRQAAP